MAERSPDVLALFDAQGRKTYANPSYEQVCLAHGVDVMPLLQQAQATTQPFATQLQWTDLKGMPRQLGVQLTPEVEPEGVISAWWLVGRDTTDEHQVRQRLAQREDELARCAQEFQALVEHSPDTVVRYDAEVRCQYANRAFLQLWDLCPIEIQGKRPSEYWKFGSARTLEDAVRQVAANQQPHELEYVWTSKGGHRRFIHLRLIPERDAQGRLASVLTIGRDITDHKENQHFLAQAEVMAGIGHWQWDFAQQKSSTSDELCRIFDRPAGWQPTPEEALESSVPHDRERIRKLYESAFALQLPELTYNYQIVNAQGNTLDLHTHVRIDYGPRGPQRLRGTTRDITELKQYEARLNEIALRDPLTGLPNRTFLNDRLHTAMAEAIEEGKTGGLLLVNLDHFKEVNDILGHGYGDHLLIHCGKRLQLLVRAYDTVARLGADEFALILPQVRDIADLEAIAKKIIDAMAQPFVIGDQSLFVTCSIGIAQFPIDGVQAHELLQHADSALTEAKTNGRSGHHLYSAKLTQRARERAQLGIALRRAEADGQLEVYYQPKVALAHGTWVGAEALVRWNHPTAGLVMPDKFIGLAEENGLIVGIGTWVLTEACLAARRWNAGARRPFKVAVNLSPVQFRKDNLAATVRHVLSTTGCDPRWLELEITESLLLDGNEDVRTTLCALRELGVTVAIDDFGTGYSSLAYLKRFSIDVLKIDRTFVRDIGIEHNSTELTKAIISMGNSLNMQLVAEGVESPSQASFLLAQGCPLAQGYMYGKPMPRHLFESAWHHTEAQVSRKTAT